MPRKGDVTVYGPTVFTTNDDGDRNIFVSTELPTTSQGQNGDIWLIYEESSFGI